jgi:hypothetical protein
MAPITPPAIDEKRAAPSARPACPFRAIGKPSMQVAALGPVPGVSKSMAGIEPDVCTTECMPNKKAKPETGSIPNVKGIISAREVGPPKPGIIPNMRPMGMARSMYPKAGHARTERRPLITTSSIYLSQVLYCGAIRRTITRTAVCCFLSSVTASCRQSFSATPHLPQAGSRSPLPVWIRLRRTSGRTRSLPSAPP